MHLTVYGFGNRGRDVVDQLIAQGLKVAMIFDKNPSCENYRNIEVRSLEDPIAIATAAGSHCIVGLHNSYVDIHEIYCSLIELLATPVSLINADSFGIRLVVDQGYWLDKSSQKYIIENDDERWMLVHLADDISRKVFSEIKKYRQTGDFSDCPVPSTEDEYLPNDLPSYPEPINLLDCGAFTGIAYRKFAKKYKVAKYLAFEPDLKNFSELRTYKFNSDFVTLLPLGVWNKTEVIKFSAGKEMGSTIDSQGSSIIQCVAVDDVVPTFDPTIIKFDVEGAELNGLLGMRRLIERNRPSLCISVYHRPEDMVTIPKLIVSWGLDYKLYLRNHEYNGFGTVLYARPQTHI